MGKEVKGEKKLAGSEKGMKAVDMAISKVAPAYADDMKWKAEDAMRDIARVEGHKKDVGLMKEVKGRVKSMAKALGC